jgi:uncharacterized protein (UPF0264 family)
LPGLLVSVRSAHEARAAVEGGAAVIDIKDPSRGPLGRASGEVWEAVRAAVPAGIPVSVALGELADWAAPAGFEGIELAYRKIGLAGAQRGWADRWAGIVASAPGPPWIAVIYADWTIAGSPRPEEVLDVALSAPRCAGVLVDTWDKSRPGGLDLAWAPIVERVQGSGRLLALAGRLDLGAIRRLSRLGPDLFAVRGAACAGGDRLGAVDRVRVAELVRACGPTGPGRR